MTADDQQEFLLASGKAPQKRADQRANRSNQNDLEDRTNFKSPL
jgi:hypothetical protein